MEQRKLIKLKGEIREMNCTEVYEQFKNFIYKTAHGFLNTGENIDDLIQIGNVGLIKTFNHYKIESNLMFITLLAKIITNEILMHTRKYKKIRSETSFDDYISIDTNGNALTLSDVLKDPINCEDEALKPIMNNDLKKLMNKLKPVNRKILELFYFKNMKQDDIGKELNFTQSYTSRLLKSSLEILKNKYEGDYKVNKKEECFKVFDENTGKDREDILKLAMAKTGVTRATATTYYPAWKKEYKMFGYNEKSKIITPDADIILETPNKITEVAEKSPIVPKVEQITQEEIKEIVEEIKEKVYEKPVVVEEEKEDVFIATRLIPVLMRGTYDTYRFCANGVKGTGNEGFISKNRVDEEQEALQMWERCYGEGGTKSC